MENVEIKSRLTTALTNLIGVDKYLLEKMINEPCVSHRIALHLTPLFEHYDVDCEYDGNIEENDRKKGIQVLKGELEQYKKRKIIVEDNSDSQRVKVVPDIIIHHRSRNDKNLCIIEVKKNTNTEVKYDRIKLKAYTSKLYERSLQYQFGCLIIYDTEANITIEYYQDGEFIDLEHFLPQ
jgi:hypothetical protein